MRHEYRDEREPAGALIRMTSCRLIGLTSGSVPSGLIVDGCML